MCEPAKQVNGEGVGGQRQQIGFPYRLLTLKYHAATRERPAVGALLCLATCSPSSSAAEATHRTGAAWPLCRFSLLLVLSSSPSWLPCPPPRTEAERERLKLFLACSWTTPPAIGTLPCAWQPQLNPSRSQFLFRAVESSSAQSPHRRRRSRRLQAIFTATRTRHYIPQSIATVRPTSASSQSPRRRLESHSRREERPPQLSTPHPGPHHARRRALLQSIVRA